MPYETNACALGDDVVTIQPNGMNALGAAMPRERIDHPARAPQERRALMTAFLEKRAAVFQGR